MQVSYMKLQKLMIENQMKRNDLMRAAEISGTTATKINKNEPVSLEVLMRICKVFHCDIGDIYRIQDGAKSKLKELPRKMRMTLSQEQN